ncbi:hypothetical protein ASPWEDRAFT_63199 [Aspergillus wentii DTO 134E9]|uniref:NADP-dependent oxidoreductase domain-containing protein n=1 Tax=Aspergillus wentii DTO 134E9 TaxID=1073089 RepID=A0A1L9R753_ASPWE|nr:uncharacterized protein ASPWEDRAFT_63199 [Aspergillus wentii DTO 134E9]OJJ30734.1 hypothetical protein ASPWEDRAFT_63199 [Aspergillus wentii DTO 134E9]
MLNMEQILIILSVKLNDHVLIQLGYDTGTAWYKTAGDTSINRELVESIKTAIKLGYYHLDGAEVYGPEAELGLFYQSGVEREENFLVKDAGKARSIVVSNFLQSHLDTVSKSARIPPSTNQIEYHPYLQHGNLVPFQKDKGIQTASYAPLTPATWRKYAVDEGEILLRWSLNRSIVTITTCSKESRLISYPRAPNFTLTPKEIDGISELG